MNLPERTSCVSCAHKPVKYVKLTGTSSSSFHPENIPFQKRRKKRSRRKKDLPGLNLTASETEADGSTTAIESEYLSDFDDWEKYGMVDEDRAGEISFDYDASD